MQNRYAGDIGDYSKLVLLKRLFGNEKIGLVWYLYPNENHNSDGKYREYKKYKKDLGDEELIEILDRVSKPEDDRGVATLENELKIYFGEQQVIYFNEEIEKEGYPYTAREGKRKEWLEKACKKVKECPVVFLDPDNGIEVKSVKKRHKKGGKYVYYDEIEKFFKQCEVLVIYQHFAREKHCDFVKRKAEEIFKNVKGDYSIYALKFNKVSSRLYYFLVKKSYKQKFEKQWHDFCDSKFSKRIIKMIEDGKLSYQCQ